jgi:hypothetical protein
MSDDTIDEDLVEDDSTSTVPLYEPSLDLDIPEFEGRTPSAVVTKLSGALDSVVRSIAWNERGYALVEWQAIDIDHGGKELKRKQKLTVLTGYELTAAEAEPIAARFRAEARQAADAAMGRVSLGNELDDTAQPVITRDGVVMTAAEIAEARGDTVPPAEGSFTIEFVGGARGVWPEDWLGLGQSLAAVGGQMRLPGSTALGETDQVSRWLDPESGQPFAEWSDADEQARLVELEEHLAAEEAKADRETVEEMARPEGDDDPPWDGYDGMTAKDVVDQIDAIESRPELEDLIAYETDQKNRVSVVSTAQQRLVALAEQA